MVAPVATQIHEREHLNVYLQTLRTAENIGEFPILKKKPGR